MSDPDPPITPADWRARVELLTRAPQLHPRRVAGAAVAVVAALAIAWFALRTPPGPPTETLLPLAGGSEEPATSTSTTSGSVVAHAAGAVVHPGVYRLPSGSRVADLVDAAGGPTADADVDQLNLAALVVDGARIYVPRQGETVAAPAAASAAAPAGPVDLNTATLEQLDALPGVGPATAQAIIDERERRGGFRSVDELLDVRGIGPAKLERIRELVCVCS